MPLSASTKSQINQVVNKIVTLRDEAAKNIGSGVGEISNATLVASAREIQKLATNLHSLARAVETEVQEDLKTDLGIPTNP